MINKLDEKLKAYSNEYFIDEFVKSKPAAEYCALESKCGVAAGAFFVLLPILILSIKSWSRLCPSWYWFSLCLFIGLFADIFFFRKLNCRRTKILYEMACAYKEKNDNLKAKVLDCGLLTTPKAQNQYINAVKNAYRADIVKRELGNEYNIKTIKVLKDEIKIKEVKLGLNFGSICSFFAVSVALAAWYRFDYKNGWPIVLGFFSIFLSGYVIFDYCVRLFMHPYKSKKYSILRETLSFMLYDYM